jgi:hypothetical protein
MNEALIFIAIMIATIPKEIASLLVVPVLASVVVIMEYLRCRIGTALCATMRSSS